MCLRLLSFSRMPLWSIIHTVKQRCTCTSHIDAQTQRHKHPHPNTKLIKHKHSTSFSLSPTKLPLFHRLNTNTCLWVCMANTHKQHWNSSSVLYAYTTIMPVLKPTHIKRHNALCPPSIFTPVVIVFLCFPIELFCGEVTCSFSLVGLPQLSVAALWQTSAASSSAQASQGITRAAWTAAGEFNSLLALVCHPPLCLSFLLLLSSVFFFFVVLALMPSLVLSSA